MYYQTINNNIVGYNSKYNVLNDVISYNNGKLNSHFLLPDNFHHHLRVYASGTGTGGLITGETDRPGIYRLTGTTGLRTDNSFLKLSSTAKYVVRFVVRLPALANSTDDFYCFLGFSTASSEAIPSTGCYVYYDRTNTNFQLYTKGSSITTTDSTVAVVANTWYDISVDANSSRVIYTINNVSTTVTTNITSNAFGFSIMNAKTLGTDKNLDIDYYEFTWSI